MIFDHNKLIAEYNELKNEKEKECLRKKNKCKRSKRRIPATVKNTIWHMYITDKEDAKCFCCHIEPITKGNF